MSAGRVRTFLAMTAVAAVISYGLSGHGPPHVTSEHGMAGSAAVLCLLLATTLVFAAIPTPRSQHTTAFGEVPQLDASSAPREPLDGSARASPSVLQRFRH